MLGCLDGLYGYAMALTHDPTEAEDLVQETYMRAALHCEKLRPDSNVKAWMFTIMRNRWFKQLRHENSATGVRRSRRHGRGGLDGGLRT